MILLIDEITKDSLVSANSNVINYPVSNVLDSRLTRIYRTVLGITTAEIVFDAGSAVTIDSIAVANHNISSGVTTLKIQGNATNAWTSPSINETLTYSSGIINKQFTGGSYRYWRLQVIDVGNSDTYIQIGRIGLYSKFVPSKITPVVGHSRISNSEKSISVSGQSYLDKRYFHSVISVRFPEISHSEKENLIEQFEIIDIGIPFFVVFDEDVLDLDVMYVTLDVDSFNFNLLGDPDYYEAAMSLREEV